MKNNKKPNLKGNRLKSYIANNEQKIKELLEKQVKEEEEWINKLKQVNKEQTEDDEAEE